MSDIQAIETNYDGRRFRSRAEARWAVFFNAAGLPYEYEKEGVVLPSGPYLPDFYLPTVKTWLEVKGGEPTEHEIQLCVELAKVAKARVLIAAGAPTSDGNLILIRGGAADLETRFLFADDRRNENEFWLAANDGSEGFSIGPDHGPPHDRLPNLYGAAGRGYKAAMSARFEHGEKG